MTTATTNPTIINEKSISKSVECASVLHAALETVGLEIGIYDAMTEYGPVTPTELSQYIEIPESYINVWLGGQLAGDFVDYNPNTGKYSLWCAYPPIR